MSGSSRVLFPRRSDPVLEAVLLNTSGGLTSGDRFETMAHVGPRTQLTLTTQAAERAYRNDGSLPSRIHSCLTIEAGASLDWLPQETILFDAAALDRSLTINMSTSSRFLMVEPMIFGRTAMGETVHTATLIDRITLHRNEQIIFADRVRLTGDLQAQLNRPAIAGGARAMAAIVLAAPNAATFLNDLRRMLPPGSGASLIRDGLLFARILAPDGHGLRQILLPVLRKMRGCDLPKTWMI